MIIEKRKGSIVLSSFIDALSWDEVLSRILLWARNRESKYVVICNVHSVVTAILEPQHNLVISTADMATADGAPVAWMLRHLGFPNQQRINGPDLMWKYCAIAQGKNESIYLYGGSSQTLQALKKRLNSAFPKLIIAGAYSPPFHALTQQEDDAVVKNINASGSSTVWVALGCPKQEHWMSEHRSKVNAVMIGVGAAFDYHANSIDRAPLWMQEGGLEWLYRLSVEPKRLWKRYLVTNSLFVVKATLQILNRKINK